MSNMLTDSTLFHHIFYVARCILLTTAGAPVIHSCTYNYRKNKQITTTILLRCKSLLGNFGTSVLVGVTLTCTTQLNIIADQVCSLKGTWQRDFMSLAPWIIWILELCGVNFFSFFIVFFTRLHAPALYFSFARVSSIFEHDKVHKP